MSNPFLGEALLVLGLLIPREAEAFHLFSGQRCLYEISKGTELGIARGAALFSIHPTLKSRVRALEPEAGAETIPEPELTASFEMEESVPAEFAAGDDWPQVDWLSQWQIEWGSGLSRNFGERRSTIALEYSDIFETGADPERGGHGFGLLFRYKFQ